MAVLQADALMMTMRYETADIRRLYSVRKQTRKVRPRNWRTV